MENQFSRVVDALPGLVWTALPDGQTDFLNTRWREYTGLGFDQASGHAWQKALHPEDRQALVSFWQSILASGEAGETEARLRRFDGVYRRFLFRAAPLTDESGRIVKWCGMNTDIEDRRRAEEALRAREGHFRSIFDGLPALVTLMSPAGELELANRHVLEFFGATLDELKSWARGASFHPDDYPAVLEAWDRSVETGQSYESEARQRRADGTYRWVRIRGYPLSDGEGRIVNWYFLQDDIDDAKRVEALLAGEKQLLEMVATRSPLPVVLAALCGLIDATVEGSASCILLLDRTNTRVQLAVGPGLPPDYLRPLEGRLATCDAGPCGLEADLKAQVIVSDLTSDARWDRDGWPAVALAHGVRSVWSTPILSLTGELLGTFAINHRAVASPTPRHQALIQQFTHVASIAIERTRTEEELRRSEAFLAQAQRMTLTGSIWWRVATGEIIWSAENYRLMQYPPAVTPTVDMILDRCHPDDVGLVRETIERAARHGTSMDYEHRLLMPDGSVKHVHVLAQNVGPDPGDFEFVGAVTDITERKRAEEDLRRSEAFLAETRHLSLTGGFLKRMATGEITWSDEIYRMFEFEPGTTVTLERILTRVHPEDVHSFEDMIEAQRRGSDYQHEYRLLMPDRSVKHLHVVAQASRNEDGKLEYIAAVQDVTPRRLSEEALDKARSELARVTRVMSLGALTASIAHEVNQPLSGIITNASTCLRMLAADPPNIDGALETAKRTIRDGNRAADVIARLRALFAKRAAASESVDLNEAAREVIALSWNELQRNRVVLRSELAEDLPPITGDRVQLQQVILNLLLNGSEAMNSVEGRPRLLAVRTGRDEGDGVRLSVQDAGVGFEEQGAESLFEAFYSTKSGGMGIGLSVSRSIIESHHGRLWARPNDGPGATFSFSIPRAVEGAAAPQGPAGVRTLAAADAAHVASNQ